MQLVAFQDGLNWLLVGWLLIRQSVTWLVGWLVSYLVSQLVS
jgi:hypothetical protein